MLPRFNDYAASGQILSLVLIKRSLASFFPPALRFYIGCDRCQNWYHGRCVGILQSEANHIDEYVCPQCQSTEDAMTVLTPLTEKDYEGLRRILRSLTVSGTQPNMLPKMLNSSLSTGNGFTGRFL